MGVQTAEPMRLVDIVAQVACRKDSSVAVVAAALDVLGCSLAGCATLGAVRLRPCPFCSWLLIRAFLFLWQNHFVLIKALAENKVCQVVQARFPSSHSLHKVRPA
jgi:hypothetical protein